MKRPSIGRIILNHPKPAKPSSWKRISTTKNFVWTIPQFRNEEKINNSSWEIIRVPLIFEVSVLTDHELGRLQRTMNCWLDVGVTSPHWTYKILDRWSLGCRGNSVVIPLNALRCCTPQFYSCCFFFSFIIITISEFEYCTYVRHPVPVPFGNRRKKTWRLLSLIQGGP